MSESGSSRSAVEGRSFSRSFGGFKKRITKIPKDAQTGNSIMSKRNRRSEHKPLLLRLFPNGGVAELQSAIGVALALAMTILLRLPPSAAMRAKARRRTHTRQKSILHSISTPEGCCLYPHADWHSSCFHPFRLRCKIASPTSS